MNRQFVSSVRTRVGIYERAWLVAAFFVLSIEFVSADVVSTLHKSVSLLSLISTSNASSVEVAYYPREIVTRSTISSGKLDQLLTLRLRIDAVRNPLSLRSLQTALRETLVSPSTSVGDYRWRLILTSPVGRGRQSLYVSNSGHIVSIGSSVFEVHGCRPALYVWLCAMTARYDSH